jgi:hypothetical protein
VLARATFSKEIRLACPNGRELTMLRLVLSRADTKTPEESLLRELLSITNQIWTTFMKRRRSLTAAEKRVLSALRTHGSAVRIWVSHRQDDYSWWIAGRPVTRMVHSLAVKGFLKLEGNEARLAA